jgi:hypothetical protein
MLLPAKSISDSGQCFVPQRQRCLGMVFRSSQIHRGLQSPSLLSRTQCTGKNMASRSSARYPQSIFHNPRRTPLRSDFDISQHTEESISSYGLSASISIKHHVALFMQCCIAVPRLFIFRLYHAFFCDIFFAFTFYVNRLLLCNILRFNSFATQF